MSRFQKLIVAGVASLVLVVAIVGTILITNQVTSSEQSAYERCLEIHGYSLDNLPTTREGQEQMLAATEDC